MQKILNNREYLTRSERIARIGELLAKGIALLLLEAGKQTCKTSVENASKSSLPALNDPVANEVFQYVARVHESAPRDVQRALGLPKSTVYRRLSALVRCGYVTRVGTTTACRYRCA